MRFESSARARRSEQGYILLTLMLFVALITIGAVAIAPSITFQIQRDREEELIHRGTQYSRAIRNYFKKFGRYPTDLKDLDNTNNMRFLRKHYKDPITGKDFRLLHFSEVQMMSQGGGMAGATSAAAMAAQSGQGPGGQTGGGFSLGSSSKQTTGGEAGTENNSGTSQGGSEGGQPQIIGGPIVGVTSTSKAKSIREFSNKDHYNQWQFIYDPTMDRGTTPISTPFQPLMPGTNMNINNNAPQPGPGIQGPAGVPGLAPSPSPAPTQQQSPGQSPTFTPNMPPDQ